MKSIYRMFSTSREPSQACPNRAAAGKAAGKRLFVAAVALAWALSASAKELTLRIANVRSDRGLLLVAANGANPAYARAAAVRDTMEIVLRNVSGESITCTLLHDEDGDYRMTTDAAGKPAEGYAFVTCSLAGEAPHCDVLLTYPAGEPVAEKLAAKEPTAEEPAANKPAAWEPAAGAPVGTLENEPKNEQR